MARTTRRRRPGDDAPSSGRASGIDDDLIVLGAQVERLRRRVKRLGYQVRPGGDHAVWARWSRAVAECAELCERIARSPAHDLAGLAVRYRALLWELVEDDLILDLAVRRRAIAFGRELEAMAKRASDV